ASAGGAASPAGAAAPEAAGAGADPGVTGAPRVPAAAGAAGGGLCAVLAEGVDAPGAAAAAAPCASTGVEQSPPTTSARESNPARGRIRSQEAAGGPERLRAAWDCLQMNDRRCGTAYSIFLPIIRSAACALADGTNPEPSRCNRA